MNESLFFQDLAVIMAVAGFVSVICARIRFPKVIGYLAAGLVMGPHTWGGSFLVDITSINTIAQLGIVFLMFTLGLEVSTGAMKKIRYVVVPTAVVDSMVMIGLGYVVGRKVLGWGAIQSLFLGAALCDSATTMLTKTLGEMGWMKRPFVRYIFGTTICEDIICVGVIALVTSAVNGGVSAAAVGKSFAGLAVFFTVTLVGGMIAVPRIINRVAGMRDNEALLLTILSCCFFVSFIAYKFDFSMALGAFIVGLLGASSEARQRLHDMVSPLSSMFSAMFFVSVGLLIDHRAWLGHWGIILMLTAVVVGGKSLNCFVMSILTGQKVKDAVQTALGLAQIGEFAYLVALIYISCTGDMNNPMFQIAVGVSIISTCLSPIMLRLSDPFGDWLERNMPGSVRGLLASYRSWLRNLHEAIMPNPVKVRIRRSVVWLVVTAALSFGAHFLVTILDGFDYTRWSTVFDTHKTSIFFALFNLFWLVLLFPRLALARALGRDIATVLPGGNGRGRWFSAVHLVVTLFCAAAVVAACVLELVITDAALPVESSVVRWATIIVMTVIGIFGWRRFRRVGMVAGYRFRRALNAERRMLAMNARTAAKAAKTVTLTVPSDYYVEFNIPPESEMVGRTIRELDIRARTGVTVIRTLRDGVKTRNPGPEWRFAAGDGVIVVGDPNHVTVFRQMLGLTRRTSPSA